MGLDLDLIREHVKTCDRNAHPCGSLLYEVERLREALAAKRSPPLPEGLRDPVKAFARGRELLERRECGPTLEEQERLRADSPTANGDT